MSSNISMLGYVGVSLKVLVITDVGEPFNGSISIVKRMPMVNGANIGVL